MQRRYHHRPLLPAAGGVAIPLWGYVVCNLLRAIDGDKVRDDVSQSPYGAKWFATRIWVRKVADDGYFLSQSPYGAKWFATTLGADPEFELVVSQSPYGAKWFATLPPQEYPSGQHRRRGVFVRKMKLRICIGQRVGVLRGLGRWEDFGRGVKGECISEYRRPRGKKLAFKVPSRMPGTGTL